MIVAMNTGDLVIWLGVLAYAIQIYFDFSGYSDMAIGLGLMLGFHLPKNFNSPYRAASITDGPLDPAGGPPDALLRHLDWYRSLTPTAAPAPAGEDWVDTQREQLKALGYAE